MPELESVRMHFSSKLERVRIGKGHIRKVSELERVTFGKCQNWKVSDEANDAEVAIYVYVLCQ